MDRAEHEWCRRACWETVEPYAGEFIIAEKVNRAIVALVGRRACDSRQGVMNQDEALKGGRWNTIGPFLTGMMLLVSGLPRCHARNDDPGMTDAAVWSAQTASANTRPALQRSCMQIATACSPRSVRQRERTGALAASRPARHRWRSRKSLGGARLILGLFARGLCSEIGRVHRQQ